MIGAFLTEGCCVPCCCEAFCVFTDAFLFIDSSCGFTVVITDLFWPPSLVFTIPFLDDPFWEDFFAEFFFKFDEEAFRSFESFLSFEIFCSLELFFVEDFFLVERIFPFFATRLLPPFFSFDALRFFMQRNQISAVAANKKQKTITTIGIANEFTPLDLLFLPDSLHLKKSSKLRSKRS